MNGGVIKVVDWSYLDEKSGCKLTGVTCTLVAERVRICSIAADSVCVECKKLNGWSAARV